MTSLFFRVIALVLACATLAHAQASVAPAPGSRTLAVSPAGQGKRIALVIGNDAYRKVSKLEKAGNDATAMARELKAAGFEVLLHRDLDYRGMVKAVETLANSITGGDQVVVFFAGHGVQIKSGSYLLPVDIEANSESEVEKTAYGLNDLTDKLSDAKASFALVMVDACRDNPLKSKGRSIGGTRGLSAIEPPKGQMVIYSASKGQQALDRLNDGDPHPNGVFTREFIARMKRPGVRIEDLVREVQESVETLARTVSHDQRPAIYNEARGNFYFFAPATVNVAAPAASAQVRIQSAAEIEQELWTGIKDSRDAAVFEEYLRQYPQGRYLGLARVTLARLKADARPAAASPAPPAVGEPGAMESARMAWEKSNRQQAEIEAALKRLDANPAPTNAEPARPAAPGSEDSAFAIGGPEIAVSLVGLAVIGGALYLLVFLLRRALRKPPN